MGRPSTHPFEARITATNVGYFLREFSISRTKFVPPGGTEVELADNIVLVDDLLFVTQAKNRESVSSDAARDGKWFRKTVGSLAVQQIRSTLDHVAHAPPFPNEHGEETTIPRDLSRLRVFKLVIYNAGPALPIASRRCKGRLDDKAGFVHFFHIDDYEAVLRTLVTLPEIVGYLEYREAVTRKFALAPSSSEKAVLGGYLRYDEVIEPLPEHERFVDQLIDTTEDFDIGGILHKFRDKIYGFTSSGPQVDGVHSKSALGQYHAVLRQLLRLSRTALSKFKERYLWARDTCGKAMTRPSLFAVKDSDAELSDGFVFCPIPADATAEQAATGLQNFTLLAKHHLKVDRALGVSMRRDGDGHYLVDWALRVAPWREDPELDQRLAQNSPFRELNEATIGHYRFRS